MNLKFHWIVSVTNERISVQESTSNDMCGRRLTCLDSGIQFEFHCERVNLRVVRNFDLSTQ